MNIFIFQIFVFNLQTKISRPPILHFELCNEMRCCANIRYAGRYIQYRLGDDDSNLRKTF